MITIFPRLFSKANRFLKLTLLVLLVGVGTTGCDNLDSKPEIDTSGTIDRAEAYLNQGQFRAASIEAKNALQRDPANEQAHRVLAKLALEIGQPKQAIKQLTTSKQDNAEYYLLLAKAYSYTGKHFSAKKVLDENAKKIQAEEPLEYGLLLATTQFRLDDEDGALETLSNLEKLSNLNDKEKAELFLKLASLHQARKDLTLATEYLDKSIEANSTSEALLQKGAIAFTQDNLEEAEDHLSNALISLKNTDIITPLRINVLKGLIQTLSKSGRSSEALIYSKLLSEATPNAEENRNKFETALQLYKDGELDKAEEILTELYNNNRNEFSGRMLGLIKAMKGELSEADTLLSEHIDPEIASSKAVGVLAETKLKLRQNEAALKILSEKIGVTPNDPNILSVYGIALLSSGQVDKGVETIKKALKIAPDNTNLKMTLANVYAKQGKRDEALALFKQAHNEAPDSENIALTYVKAMLAADKYEDAVTFSQSLLSKKPESGLSHRIAGLVSLSKNDIPTAIGHLEQAVKLSPENLAINFNLGQSYVKNKELQKAIQTFEKAINIAPSNPAAYKAYISAHELNSSKDAGIKHLNDMAAEDITLWAPQTVLAEYYLRNGLVSEADTAIESALQRNAVQPYPQTVALNLYMQQSRQALAKDDFANVRASLMKGLQLKPDNIQFLAMLATTEIKSGQNREATKLIEQIRTDFPKSGVADELLGDMELKAEKLDEALQQYRTSWDVSPSNSSGEKIYHLSKKLKKETAAHLDDWSEKIPTSFKPVLFQAMNNHEAGNIESAEALYEKALARNPNILEALNNLAWLKFEAKDSDAEALAKQGADRFPNSAAMLDTYGWILFNNGKKEQAQEVLKRAHDLAPDNKEISKHYETSKG